MKPLSAMFVKNWEYNSGMWRVFCKPFSEGGKIVEVEMVMPLEEFEKLDIAVFATWQRAYEYAEFLIFCSSD